MKNKAEIPVGKLRPNTVPERLWQYISIDFIMKLLVFKDHNSILIVYNRFLKILYFIAIIEQIIAEELARLFRDNVQKLHGLLESVISDREPQFVVGLMLNKMLGIEIKLSTAFYLQIDRWSERANQELEQYLRIYINHRQGNWLEWLKTTEFVFNNKVYTTTKSLPFKVNYKRELRIGFEIRKKGKHVKVEEFMKEMKKIHKEAKVVLKKS